MSHRSPMKILLPALLTVVAFLFAGTAAASTGSIVYVKDHNVWLANADGTGEYQVTEDGTYEQPWRSPSQADDGTIAASHYNNIVRMKQNGQILNVIDPPALINSVSHPTDGVPVKVAISPNGKMITWSFVTYECPIGVSCGARAVTGYTAADRLTDPKKYGSSYFTDPSWIGNDRTLQSGGYGSQVNIDDLGDPGEPVHWFDDSDYAENDTDLSDAELSPDGKRLAAVRGYGNSTHIIWYSVNGNALSGPPPAAPTPDCLTGELEGLSGPSWSPDGDALVWQEPDGLWLKSNVGVCDSPQPKLLIAGGSEPDWGPAAVNPGPRGGTINVRPGKAKLKSALKKGYKIQVKALAAGPVKVQLRQGKKLVATGSAKARKAGWVMVTAKFTKKAKKKLAKAKKVTLMATVTVDGQRGTLPVKLKK